MLCSLLHLFLQMSSIAIFSIKYMYLLIRSTMVYIQRVVQPPNGHDIPTLTAQNLVKDVRMYVRHGGSLYDVYGRCYCHRRLHLLACILCRRRSGKVVLFCKKGAANKLLLYYLLDSIRPEMRRLMYTVLVRPTQELNYWHCELPYYLYLFVFGRGEILLVQYDC